MKNLIIIPTYNESENITALVQEVFRLHPSINILVVDDNSPDGTAEKVLNIKSQNLHLLKREKKEGLGKAYLAGFDWALKRDFDFVTQMDSDFSHRPEDLKVILEKIQSADVVIGSRYIEGGGY